MTVVTGWRCLSLLSLSHASPTSRSVVHNVKLAKQRTAVTVQFSSTTGLSSDESASSSSSSSSSSSITSNQDESKAWHLPAPAPAPAGTSTTPLERLKHPARGGQDLSARYVRLERALRGKEGYEREIEGFEGEKRSLDLDMKLDLDLDLVESAGKEIEIGKGKGKGKGPLVFAGYIIPEAPKPPESDECCMSGCVVCVHDLYAEALESYESALDALRTALSAKGVPEGTWPAQVRFGLLQGGGEGSPLEGRGGGKEDLRGRELVKARQATLSAFEQMELQLAARRSGTQGQDTGSPQKTVETSDPSPPGSTEGTRTKARKSIRSGSSSSLTGKAMMEALSWVLFSRR